MQYVDERNHLRVSVQAEGFTVPEDERARLQRLLAPVAEAVRDFPTADLQLKVIHHPRSEAYNAEARLKLPGRTLFTGDRAAYLDSALQRCLDRLGQRLAAYKQQPDPDAAEQVRRRLALDRDLVAPEDPDAGPLAAAAQAGDYRAFRTALSVYEEWLRKRVGRWVQRYPEAQARVGNSLLIGDLVEEVYLNAFEQFARRPTDIRLSAWLDHLLDPSLQALLRHPDAERENISMARTLREMPLTGK
jgi:hypothetical protein